MRKTLILFGVVLLLLVASFFGGRIYENKHHFTGIKTETDTLIQWRVETVEKPVYCTEKVVDTVFAMVDKTRTIHDTVFVPLPVTQRVYEGQYYDLAVSGYKPTLDYINVKIPTTTITEKPKHNSVMIGVSASVWNTATIVPSLGYEYTYGRFRANAGIGYDVQGEKPLIMGQVSFDLFQW